MKIFKFLSFILIIYCSTVSCQLKNYSYHRSDNDFSTYNDNKYCQEIEISKLVFKNIRNSIDTIRKSIFPIKFDDCYLHSIHINDTIDIIVLSIKSFVLTKHLFFVNNTKTGQLVKSNFSINGKWAKNNEDGFEVKLMELPNAKIENIENESVLTIKERVHNGNSYNAVIQKYFKVDCDKLTIDLKYCIEIKAIGFDDAIIERLAEGNEVKVYKQDKNNIREIGSFILSSDKKTIESKYCLDEYYCSQLVTCSGLEDQIILKEGYSFRN